MVYFILFYFISFLFISFKFFFSSFLFLFFFFSLFPFFFLFLLFLFLLFLLFHSIKGVYCENNDQDVDQLLERLRLTSSAHRLFSLEPVSSPSPSPLFSPSPSFPSHIPSPCTIRDAFKKYCDIMLTSRPSVNILRTLLEYCTNKSEKNRLQDLCSVDNRKELDRYLSCRPSLLEILNDFPSSRPPLAHLLDILPPLLPRYYSISNSPLSSPSRLHFCFTCVEYPVPVWEPSHKEKTEEESQQENKSKKTKTKQGICSSWLKTLSGGTGVELSMFFRPRSRFCVPKDVNVPLVLVGPGTGIAPFVGFLQHRLLLLRSSSSSSSLPKSGECLVFFGCRWEKSEYLYRKELEEMEKEGVCKVVTAFSRETEEVVYVQDRLLEYSQNVFDIVVRQNGKFFVCGFVCFFFFFVFFFLCFFLIVFLFSDFLFFLFSLSFEK